jgi:bifunctional lysine-specific demethylase and histidyl-hydroxylase NO66
MAEDEPALRAGFPLGVDITDPDQLAPHLGVTVDALRAWLDRADTVAVAERLRQREWHATRPAPIRPLAQTAAMAELNADSLLAPRGGLRWRVTSVDTDRVALQLPDRTLTVPSYCEPALRAVLAGPQIRLGDLPELDPADQVTLARRLLREAVVVPAEKL